MHKKMGKKHQWRLTVNPRRGPPGFKGAGRPEGQAARMDGLSVGARTLAIKLHEQAGCWTQLRGALPAAVLPARVA
jgi:hypothetical protein